VTVQWVEDPSRFPWENTADGARGRTYWAPLFAEGTQPFIGNVDVSLGLLAIGDHPAPLVINDGVRRAQAWVVSPTCQFVDYAAEETRELDSPVLRAGIKGALATLGAGWRAGRLDRVVYVDDWLVSTNLRPDLERTALDAATQLLIQRFPTHAIAWRSIHTWQGDRFDAALAELEYLAVPSRSVWLLDPRQPGALGSRNLDHDARLLRTRGYRIVSGTELGPDSIPRLRELYDALYLDKYSRHNPWYTDRFLGTALAGGLEVRALVRDGKIDGVLGFFRRGGAMTTPVFGYDTTLPARDGLYRMLSRILVDEAVKAGVILHQSAGAASFKRARRAEGALEVTRVYTRHLGIPQRLAWTTLAQALWQVAVPLVRARGL
jgi:hypothetical protein